jgi:hypothetical protein
MVGLAMSDTLGRAMGKLISETPVCDWAEAGRVGSNNAALNATELRSLHLSFIM